MDELAHEPCYIFKSSVASLADIDDRPRKRRKTAPEKLHTEETWPRLLGGLEPEECARQRQEAFHAYWEAQGEAIDKVINAVDEQALEKLNAFVDNTHKPLDSRVPTALLVSGPDSSAQQQIIAEWATRRQSSNFVLVQINNAHASNLQTVLRNLIKSAIVKTTGLDQYHDFITRHKRKLPMNFDLELLRLFAVENSIDAMVVTILDVETIDGVILSELISAISSWMNRICFKLIVGVSTTIQLFESRLPRLTISLLHAFEINLTHQSDKFLEITKCVQTGSQSRILLDTTVLGVLSELLADGNNTLSSYKRILKYLFLTHFFTNPLTTILQGNLCTNNDSNSHACELIRQLPSFRDHCDRVLKESSGSDSLVRQLLESDQFLLKYVTQSLESHRDELQGLHEAVLAFCELYALLQLPLRNSVEMYSHILENLSGFTSSELFADVLDALQQLETVSNGSTSSTPKPKATSRATSIEVNSASDILAYVRSLQQHMNRASEEQTTKNILQIDVRALAERAASYFRGNLQSKEDNFLEEVLLVNIPTAFIRGKTQLRPRQAIERALGSPSDYLNCECCSTRAQINHEQTGTDSMQKGTKSSLPPASMLYQLLGEAGATINARDLWDAFCNSVDTNSPLNANSGQSNGIQNGTSADDTESLDDRTALTHFYTALSELRMLGLVKQGKRRPGMAAGVDLLAKTTWAGM